jgi:hypothetical protein
MDEFSFGDADADQFAFGGDERAFIGQEFVDEGSSRGPSEGETEGEDEEGEFSFEEGAEEIDLPEDEGPEFVTGWKHAQEAKSSAFGTKSHRLVKSADEAAKEILHRIIGDLTDKDGHGISDSEKTKMVDRIIDDTPELELRNLKLVAMAHVWIKKKYRIHENVEAFSARNQINPMDLVRYVRLVKG